MPEDSPGRWLAVAKKIGDHLCSSSFNHDGRSTWMGWKEASVPSGSGGKDTFTTLGPDLYDGTAGVALFLAEMWRHTTDPIHRERAEAALRHACTHADRIKPVLCGGLYSGATGIAYAATRISQLFGEDEWADEANRLLTLAFEHLDPEAAFVDVISGAAGAAPALLLMSTWLERPELIDRAAELGHLMIQTADRSPKGWSWGYRATGVTFRHNLTGLAHGAAGFGWSLTELDSAVGSGAFAQAARATFDYEAAWFNPQEENWPDLRSNSEGGPSGCSMAWCHGAPGIGLSRWRAHQLSEDPSLARDVAAATSATSRALRSGDLFERIDFSLCHGVAGLCECLLGMDPDGDATRSLILDVAGRGAERWGHDPRSWPGGMRRIGHPGLMTGVAGVGHFYLRLADPSVPSVLLVHPE